MHLLDNGYLVLHGTRFSEKKSAMEWFGGFVNKYGYYDDLTEVDRENEYQVKNSRKQFRYTSSSVITENVEIRSAAIPAIKTLNKVFVTSLGLEKRVSSKAKRQAPLGNALQAWQNIHGVFKFTEGRNFSSDALNKKHTTSNSLSKLDIPQYRVWEKKLFDHWSTVKVI